jgi:hypothetical protein
MRASSVRANEEEFLFLLYSCRRTFYCVIEKIFLQKVVGAAWLWARRQAKNPSHVGLPYLAVPRGGIRLQQTSARHYLEDQTKRCK